MSAVFTDQLGRTVTLEKTPERIVSLVPSQTELLHALGLGTEVAGITKFCIHPVEWFRSKTRVGGTKQINFEKIAALQPDLIIANKEENEQAQIEMLMQDYPVWISDIKTLPDAYAMIRSVGEMTGCAEKANAIAEEISERFENFRKRTAHFPKRKTAYFIWKNPWMAAGGDTFIDHLLRECGMENVFSDKGRYPEVTLEELSEKRPELVLLSSEPYPFKEKHIEEIRSVLPEATIRTVDGELFSWYGSRLLHAPAYFLELLGSIASAGDSGNS